jgi:hypothetical protein
LDGLWDRDDGGQSEGQFVKVSLNWDGEEKPIKFIRSSSDRIGITVGDRIGLVGSELVAALGTDEITTDGDELGLALGTAEGCTDGNNDGAEDDDGPNE